MKRQIRNINKNAEAYPMIKKLKFCVETQNEALKLAKMCQSVLSKFLSRLETQLEVQKILTLQFIPFSRNKFRSNFLKVRNTWVKYPDTPSKQLLSTTLVIKSLTIFFASSLTMSINRITKRA